MIRKRSIMQPPANRAFVYSFDFQYLAGDQICYFHWFIMLCDIEELSSMPLGIFHHLAIDPELQHLIS